MIKSVIGIIAIFFLIIVYSCSDTVSVDEYKENTESSGERIIRIVFSFPGDDIGSPEHQAILHKIITAIRSKDAGDVLSSGFGMGNMEIKIIIRGDNSIKLIKKIIFENYPDANYRITKPLPQH